MILLVTANINNAVSMHSKFTNTVSLALIMDSERGKLVSILNSCYLLIEELT